jgi:predicted molibdopterin-dependent oxidoreductase YjgC
VKLQSSAANFLTNAVFDPTAGIPEYKVCAVRIDKIDAAADSAPKERVRKRR